MDQHTALYAATACGEVVRCTTDTGTIDLVRTNIEAVVEVDGTLEVHMTSGRVRTFDPLADPTVVRDLRDAVAGLATQPTAADAAAL